MLLRCPRDQHLAEVFRADASSRPNSNDPLWHRTGYTCIGAGGPASVLRIHAMVTGSWRARVPVLRILSSPPGMTLVNLPTRLIFASAAAITAQRVVVAGLPVTVRARATRLWSCESQSCTTVAGKVGWFTFTAVQTAQVVATARWTATFDALGLTAQPVGDSPIIQKAVVKFSVIGLHRHLVTM